MIDSIGPLTGRTFAVTTVHYWPEEAGIAPYATRFAEHLAERGAGVTVLTAMPFYPHWRVFEPYAGHRRLTESRNGVTIRRIRHYIPTRQSTIRRAAYEGSFLLHGASLISLPRPDAAIALIPGITGGVLAAAIARRFAVPYGLVVQDLSGQAASQSGIAGGSRVAQFTTALEMRLARGARRTAVVAPAFADALSCNGVDSRTIVELPNWTHIPGSQPASREAIRRRFGWSSDQHIVVHAGNMGLKQALESVVDAAALAASDAPAVRFVLMGDGSQRPVLERRAAGLSNISFLPPSPPDELATVLAAADTLLVNERRSVVDMSLPSKLTSYFAAGRPVVAAVRQDGTTAAEIARSGGGIVVDPESPAALIGGIDRLARDPDLSQRLGDQGTAYARSHLSEATALHRIDHFVNDLLTQPNSRSSR